MVFTADDTAALVAAHVGAWIEIENTIKMEYLEMVAPHVGAWIEMDIPDG